MNENHYILMNLPEEKKFDFFCGSFFALQEINKKMSNIDDVDELKTKIREELKLTRLKLNELMLRDMKSFNDDE